MKCRCLLLGADFQRACRFAIGSECTGLAIEVETLGPVGVVRIRRHREASWHGLVVEFLDEELAGERLSLLPADPNRSAILLHERIA